MKTKTRRRPPSPALQSRLTALEEMAATRGIQIHYDLLEAAGLKLKGGLCAVRGEYHLFVDRRKSTAEIIDFLEDHLAQPLPLNIPELSAAIPESEGPYDFLLTKDACDVK